uniref:Neurotransmitter-gated ion-channel ligand-binding domain-containing protein n=1 Tax=Plectus sambesii TaxID=2011161 RepID=A0A914WXW5_9BILA
MVRLWPIALAIAIALSRSTVDCLTAEERTAFSKVFKYYHRSVRPSSTHNYVKFNENATSFRLSTELTLLSSAIDTQGYLTVDWNLALRYFDERLEMRMAAEPIVVPEEFPPWTPVVAVVPSTRTTNSVILRSTTGEITMELRMQTRQLCVRNDWIFPFGKRTCQFEVFLDESDLLFDVRSFRDLREDRQVSVSFDVPSTARLYLAFASPGEMAHFLLVSFLPSALIVVAVIAAQARRRRDRLLVSLGAVCAIVFMHNAQTSNVKPSLSLLDIWLFGCFLMAVVLLIINLIYRFQRRRWHSSSSKDNSIRENLENHVLVEQVNVSRVETRLLSNLIKSNTLCLAVVIPAVYYCIFIVLYFILLIASGAFS